jgi:hypothetical protein
MIYLQAQSDYLTRLPIRASAEAFFNALLH